MFNNPSSRFAKPGTPSRWIVASARRTASHSSRMLGKPAIESYSSVEGESDEHIRSSITAGWALWGSWAAIGYDVQGAGAVGRFDYSSNGAGDQSNLAGSDGRDAEATAERSSSEGTREGILHKACAGAEASRPTSSGASASACRRVPSTATGDGRECPDRSGQGCRNSG